MTPNGNEHGTVNWLAAEMLKLCVDGKGNLPVRLCVPGQIPNGPDVDRPLSQVVSPDRDHPTVELWGDFTWPDRRPPLPPHDMEYHETDTGVTRKYDAATGEWVAQP